MTPSVDALVDEIADQRERPIVVAIAGGVGVGKSTLAATIAAALQHRGITTAIVSTDHFLHPNAELAARGLTMRKGFPESYALDAMVNAIERLRQGQPTDIPLYDHQAYDIVGTQQIDPSDVIVVEGVNALQPAIANNAAVRIYIDAHEAHAEAWYRARFDELCDRGEGFYERVAALPVDQRRAIADTGWNDINLVNLRDHIAPTRDRATHVIVKEQDHAIASITILGA